MNIKELQKRAESGDTEAMLKLAFELNEIEDSNSEDILYWTEKAAELGNAQAQFELADICKSAKDYSGAFKWFEISAKNGYTSAKYNLGGCYFEGSGTEQNYEKAFYWTEQAANENNVGAIRKLGIFYAQGIGVSVDKDKGISLLNEAVSLGDELAKDCIRELNEEDRAPKKSLIVMIVGAVIVGVIGGITGAESGSGGGGFTGFLFGAFLGIGIGPFMGCVKSDFADIWDFFKFNRERGEENSFLISLIPLIWKIPKLGFLFFICPFIAIYKLIQLHSIKTGERR